MPVINAMLPLKLNIFLIQARAIGMRVLLRNGSAVFVVTVEYTSPLAR